MDWDDPHWRSRYLVCRIGFGLLAVGLGLLCLANFSFLAQLFQVAPQLGQAQATPAWFWLVDAPIPWTTLLGSMLLLGLWKVRYWQSRVFFLVLMNAADAATWTLSNARQLGLGLPGGVPLGRYRHLVQLVTMGFGWFELLLTAALAGAVCVHLGRREGVELSLRAAQLLGAIGCSLWALTVLTQTEWRTWPPGRVPLFNNPMGILLLLVETFAQGVAAFQIALLALTASRECRRYVAEWDRHEAAALDAGPADKPPGPKPEEIDLFRG